jgi:aminoglycoside phosphotransferase (APT) family kinase protein
VDRVTGISLQDSITGPASSRHLTQTHMDWLAGLHRPGVETSMREQSEALFKRLVELEGPEERRHHVLENLLERLDDPTPLPALWVHGDFAPWNLKWAKEGRLAAVDWEEARPSGLPTIDLVHFHIIQEFLFSDKEPTETWQLLQKILNSRLVRSYFRILRIADKHLTTPLVLFALAELLSRRRVTVNGASDQFGRYLLNLIETSSPWKI